MISDDLRNRLRIAAALAVAAAACSRKAPEPAKTDAAANATTPDASVASLGGDAGGLTPAPPAVDAGALLAIVATFGRDPCPGCGMGGRLPKIHDAPKVECVIGPTEPEVAGAKRGFTNCYSNGLFARPASGGRTILNLTVNDKGEVTKSDFVESALKGVVNVCISDIARGIRFKPGPTRSVLVPLFFKHDHS